MGIIIVWMGKSMEETSKMIVCEWADECGLMISICVGVGTTSRAHLGHFCGSEFSSRQTKQSIPTRRAPS